MDDNHDISKETKETEEYDVISKEEVEEVTGYVNEHGVEGIEEFLKTKLDAWKDVEINIGVTGDSGVGKSSFINAIREVNDEDEDAAKTGVKETTIFLTEYPHPTSKEIKFWDLPGIGTPNYPNLETYLEKVNLEKCDTFLILTAGRFTQNDLALAKKVKSINKSFFFIRTKIDVDHMNEKRKKSFNEEAMLKDIKESCWEYLQGLLDGDEDVFLISNHDPAKWDFARLTQAILDVLPLRKRQALTLSLGVVKTLSKDILKRKAKILRGRIWKLASMSAAGGTVPVPGFSMVVDFVLLKRETDLYKSQLGLPDEDSKEFKKMTPEKQEAVRKLCFTTATQLATLYASYSTLAVVEEYARFIPIVGSLIGGGISFSSTFAFLYYYLNDMEETALAFLDEVATRAVDDMPVD